MRWLDGQSVRLASNLLPARTTSNDFRVIQLDEARLQKPEGIRELRSLLRKLKKSNVAEILWLSDNFPQMDFSQVGSTNKWKSTQGERNKLAWVLENQKVFLTQYTNSPKQQKKITYRDSFAYQEGWRQHIPSIFLPQVQTFRVTNTTIPYRVYPFNPNASDEQTLIWYDQTRKQSLPDLSLASYSRYI